MNVLHVTNQFWPNVGGIEKFTLDLCMQTKPLGIDSRVLCLNKGKNDSRPLPESDELNGIRIRRVPFLNLHYYKPAFLPTEELEWADVIHVHGVSALSDYLVLTKHRHQKPIVLNTHGGLFHTRSLTALKKMYFFGAQKMMLKQVELVVADSPNDFELFRPIAPHLEMIENGVDLSPFSKKTKKKPNRFLYVGRLSKNKCIDQLLETFGELDKRGVGFELRLAGPDWENLSNKLLALADKLGIAKKVVFLGEIPEKKLVSEFLSAPFFVSASRYEAFGISAIEAMAAGCVCILNSIESFQYFAENEKNAFLVRFENPTETAKRIAQIMQQDNQQIQKNALKKAESFSWKNKALEWKRVYEKCVGKPKKNVD